MIFSLLFTKQNFKTNFELHKKREREMESMKMVKEKQDMVVSIQSEMSKRKEKLILSLKNDKNHALKGKLDLLNKIRKQKQATSLRKTSNDNTQIKLEHLPEVSIESVILKQQNLLSKLNRENIDLIQENAELKQILVQKSTVQELNADLLEREQSLKEQLHLSQNYSAHFLKQYVNHLKE